MTGSFQDEISAAAAELGFSGVVRVDGSDVDFCSSYGLANRAYEVPNRPDTMFALASGTKTITGLVVMSLIAEGALRLDAPARELLNDDLPLIAEDVTVEHLLSHRSGIGDYLDEDEFEDITQYAMPIPVHRMSDTAGYLPALDGHPTVFPAGTRFAYNNSGFVVLAILAERAAGCNYHDLAHDRVFVPAGMNDTAFLRSDELPGRAAIGYLVKDGMRSNALHLPVRGHGDGGLYSTAADITTFWKALYDGTIVSRETVSLMTTPVTDWPEENRRYGLAFHLNATGSGVFIEGADAGVSFDSHHDPATGITFTAISNCSNGAWAMRKLLHQKLSVF